MQALLYLREIQTLAFQPKMSSKSFMYHHPERIRPLGAGSYPVDYSYPFSYYFTFYLAVPF